MEYYYIPNASTEDREASESLENEGIIKRKPVTSNEKHLGTAGVLGAGTLAAGKVRGEIHGSLGKALHSEFEDIRNDPERKERQFKELVKTYQNFVEKTGNRVEHFVDMPGANKWAAGRMPNGNDVVWWDSTAPHAAVMAHELGHVHMNHANPILDPLAGLQTSGLGRFSGNNAPIIGAAGALAGSMLGRKRGGNLNAQLRGAALGGGLGVVGGSGNFAYEILGASGRALGYLPEEYDQMDAVGDLTRAGFTYGMGGPGRAAVGALAATAVAAALASPRARRYAGNVFRASEPVNV